MVSGSKRASVILAMRFFLQGAGATFLAVRLGGLGWLLAWPAVTYFGLMFAYLTRSPKLLGKRDDGSLNPPGAVLFLPHILVTWIYFHLKRWILSDPRPWDAVGHGIYLGRRLLPSEIPSTCRVVVDLTAELWEPRAIVAGHEYRSLPTLNRFIPSREEYSNLLRNLNGQDRGIYIHCGAGKGRSATVAAGLLVLRGVATDVQEAEAMLRQRRPCVRLRSIERELVQTVCDSLISVEEPRTLTQFGVAQ